MPNFPEKRWSDQRAHARVPIAILASLVLSGQQESSDCLINDLSLGGAGIQYIGPHPAAGLICTLNVGEFGSFEGITTRDGGTILGVRFLIGENERHSLLEKLTAYVEDGLSAVRNFRNSERRL